MALTRNEIAARYRARHKDDPAYIARNRANARAYAKSHPEWARESSARWRANNPKKRRDVILKNRYCRIRTGQYDEMLTLQNSLCAICGKPSVGRSLEVDHNHKTEAIRGLLCHRCNVAIGFMGDDIEIARKAVAYLEKWND